MFFFSLFPKSVEELQKQAFLLKEQEHYKKALSPLKRALSQLHKEKRDQLLQAKICQQIGELCILVGDLSSAQEYIEKSLILGREGNKEFPLWYSLKLLGDLWLAKGQARLALETLQNSLEKARDYEEADLAGIYRSLGAAHSLLADYTKGVDFLHQALLVEKMGDVPSICQTFLRMGYISCMLGKTLQTKEYIKKIHKLLKRTEMKSLLGMTTFLEGLFFRTRGKKEEALHCFSMAKKILEKFSLKRQLLRVELELGMVYAELGDPKNLRKTLRKIQREMGGFQAEDVHVLWGYLEAANDFMRQEGESALEILSAHITVAKEMGFRELLWQLHYLQGVINHEVDNPEEAGKAYLCAMETLKEIWDGLSPDLKKDYLKDLPRKKVLEEAKNFVGH